jgi:hypothetical protein
MYAYTSTPGTSPPPNPYSRATVSSWIRLVDAVAVLWARRRYSCIGAVWHPRRFTIGWPPAGW